MRNSAIEGLDVSLRLTLLAASGTTMSWGGPTWQEAAELPGSAQLGMAKRLLERYEWWHLKPAPGAANPAYSVDSPLGCHAARIAEILYVVFVPSYQRFITVHLEKEIEFHAYLVSPTNSAEYDLGSATPDENGNWTNPSVLPIYQDWILVLETPESRVVGRFGEV